MVSKDKSGLRPGLSASEVHSIIRIVTNDFIFLLLWLKLFLKFSKNLVREAPNRAPSLSLKFWRPRYTARYKKWPISPHLYNSIIKSDL